MKRLCAMVVVLLPLAVIAVHAGVIPVTGHDSRVHRISPFKSTEGCVNEGIGSVRPLLTQVRGGAVENGAGDLIAMDDDDGEEEDRNGEGKKDEKEADEKEEEGGGGWDRAWDAPKLG